MYPALPLQSSNLNFGPVSLKAYLDEEKVAHKNLIYMYMQNISKARSVTIKALGKAYDDTRYLVDDLVKKSKQTDNIMLVQQKLNNLELYINTLKSLDGPRITGGRKTRKNSR